MTINFQSSLRNQLSACSVIAIAWTLTGVAHAQSLPENCEDTNGNGVAEDGEQIVCPSPEDTIHLDAADVSLTIGQPSGNYDIDILTGDGVSLKNGGPKTINILNPGQVFRTSGNGIHFVPGSAIDMDVMINAEADIFAESDGISISNWSGTGDITINAGDIFAQQTGIWLITDGDVRIDADNVTGAAEIRSAIHVVNHGQFTSITSSGSLNGGQEGIDLQNFHLKDGKSQVIVDVNDVNGAAGVGIQILAAAADISVLSRGQVYGGDSGMVLSADGDNSTISVVASDVSSAINWGIFTQTGDPYSSPVSYGAIDVSVSGTVTAPSYGVTAHIFADEGYATLNLNNVFTNGMGIDLVTPDHSYVTISGDLLGGASGWGVFGRSIPGGVTLTLLDGASIEGGLGAFQFNGDGDDVFVLNTNARATGGAYLLGGDDNFTTASNLFEMIYGGDGFDTINLFGQGWTVGDINTGSASLVEFEALNILGTGFALSGNYTDLAALNFVGGTNTFSGTADADQLTISDTASLRLAGSASLAGDLLNNGFLELSNRYGTALIDGDFRQTAGATTAIDVRTGDSTGLSVTGNITLGGTLGLSITDETFELGQSVTRLMHAGGSLTGTPDIIFLSGDGLLIDRELQLDSVAGDVNLVTTVALASDIDGLNSNQAAIGDALIYSLVDDRITDASLRSLAVNFGGLETALDLGLALNTLSPEALDMSLRIAGSTQDSFIQRLADITRKPAAGINWFAAADVLSVDQDVTSGQIGFSGDAQTLMAGASASSKTVRLTGAVGWTEFDSRSSGFLTDQSEGDLAQFAIGMSSDLEGSGFMERFDGTIGYATGSATFSAAPGGENTDLNRASLNARILFNGLAGQSWSALPYVEAGISRLKQDAQKVGSGAYTLLVDEIESTTSYGAIGFEYTADISDSTSVAADVAALAFGGDTENQFDTRFAGVSAAAPSFVVSGRERDASFRARLDVNHTATSGWTVGAGVFAVRGDLDELGARLMFSAAF